MDWSLVCSAILPNELLGFSFFFFLESYVFIGSVVPIASRLMIRSEFYNEVPNDIFFLESILSVFIDSGLLILISLFY